MICAPVATLNQLSYMYFTGLRMVPSEGHPVLGPASPAQRQQEAACPQTVGGDP